ncbi:50S ribosomal protein L4 [bacterium]|nr:50S ribosomal protein L4 [bacterium]
MVKIAVHNLKGEKVEDIKLSEAVFDLPSNNSLLHQVYVSMMSNKRQVIAHTKDRAERAGSGRKPWKQKGTGRARTGSVRNPIWRKGGIVFGPNKERNFKKKINQKMKQKSIKIALSEKFRAGDLTVVDEIKLDKKKTKKFAEALKNLNIKKSVLVGFSFQEEDFYIYCRNIEKANGIPVSELNVVDLLNYKQLMLSKKSIEYLEKKYGASNKQ